MANVAQAYDPNKKQKVGQETGTGSARAGETVAYPNGTTQSRASNSSPIIKPSQQGQIAQMTDTGTGNARAGAVGTTGTPNAGTSPASPTQPQTGTGNARQAASTTSAAPAAAQSAAWQQSTGYTPQSQSLYEQIMSLYNGIGQNLPEVTDRSADIRALYERMYGRLPENRDYSQQINDVYDRSRDAQLLALANGYDAVVRALDAAGEKIPAAYQAQGNALAGEYERQRQAMNERLAASGINSGTGSQAALAQNAGYLNGAAQIKQAQADAQAELERERVNREAEYRAAISEALANNDYQRAVALTQEMKDFQSRATQIAQMAMSIDQSLAGAQTSEWNRQDALRMQLAQMGIDLDTLRANAGASALSRDQEAALEQAKLLAGYGDFSGFRQLYGQEAADNMRLLWMAQNPQFAYMTGNMTPDQYYQMTGQYPAGYGPTGGGSSAGANAAAAAVPAATMAANRTAGTAAGAANAISNALGALFGNGQSSQQPTQQGYSAADFNRAMQSIGSARSEAEMRAAFQSLSDSGAIDRMSDAQRATLARAMSAVH